MRAFAITCRVCEIVSPVGYDQQNLGKKDWHKIGILQ